MTIMHQLTSDTLQIPNLNSDWLLHTESLEAIGDNMSACPTSQRLSCDTSIDGTPAEYYRGSKHRCKTPLASTNLEHPEDVNVKISRMPRHPQASCMLLLN
jgi:hypothetical protein